MSKCKRYREEPCYICGHYHDLDAGEPCNICGHVLTHDEKICVDSVLPTTIIPGVLYLGTYDTASRSEMLKALAITHILNTVHTCPELYKNTFQYYTVKSSPPDLAECYQYIESVISREDDSKLLVYCMTGSSRGPTVIISYLMKSKHWRLAEAYQFVKHKRGTIQLNAEDKRRLMVLELEMFNSSSVLEGFDAYVTDSFSATPSTEFVPSSQVGPRESGTTPLFAGSMHWAMTASGQLLNTSAAQENEDQVDKRHSALPFVFGSPQSVSVPSTLEASQTEMEI
ncbi:hypothetical protein CEUSTIGMA_g2859.t1 [Chlamydomonas eustigma]|uniref:Tyrosine-protein phosphatase domain-containing protein n=1 Tax=Chlamydomonas eustigma TaxID=1157962 RepID=A0A250WXA9_9CHLO|nr:hypothetical protein CEUSTIGMA_g2859.t1 [Chlamydomonas eustigma]|eukprot:GAX75415.1 hypothetical protein CEUSTIGMA_g2859.t1 [Chlamydomonas eustigma]